jgi:hypothetical protein
MFLPSDQKLFNAHTEQETKKEDTNVSLLVYFSDQSRFIVAEGIRYHILK